MGGAGGAAPGVEGGGEGEAEALADRSDAAHRRWQLRAGDDAVQHVVVGSDLAESADRALASRPETLAVGGIGGLADLAGAGPLADGAGPGGGRPRRLF